MSRTNMPVSNAQQSVLKFSTPHFSSISHWDVATPPPTIYDVSRDPNLVMLEALTRLEIQASVVGMGQSPQEP